MNKDYLIKNNTFDTRLRYKPKIDVSKLTREEQADLIIEKLANPPPEYSPDNLIYAKIAELIAQRIDEELLEKSKGLK